MPVFTNKSEFHNKVLGLTYNGTIGLRRCLGVLLGTKKVAPYLEVVLTARNHQLQDLHSIHR